MNVALVVITDGRPDYLPQALASAEANLPALTSRIMVDDSGIPGDDLPGWTCVRHPERRGIAAAVNSGWLAAVEVGAEWVFHLEDDFTFDAPVALDEMVAVLDAHPYLAQMLLPKQPWFHADGTPGALFLESDMVTPVPLDVHEEAGFVWTEHDRIFSFNPSLIPWRVFGDGFPDIGEEEFACRLRDAGYRFAFWGRPDDPPQVTHIGLRRSEGWRT
jgi:glycosyltransferase involved in cell wall biosynthesis